MTTQTVEKLTYSLNETAEALGICLSKVYELVHQENSWLQPCILRSGRRIMISKPALIEQLSLENLKRQKEQAGGNECR